MLVAFATVTLVSCAAPPQDEQTRAATLVDHRMWSTTPPASDPLPSHQPALIDCGVAGWYLEYGFLEVDTSRCNYVSLEHPALVDVAAGTPITARLVYYDLEAEPSQAHAALLVENKVVWEAAIDIPQLGNALDIEWRTETAIPAGTPIRFHLHNHGQNHWSLEPLMTRVPR